MAYLRDRLEKFLLNLGSTPPLLVGTILCRTRGDVSLACRFRLAVVDATDCFGKATMSTGAPSWFGSFQSQSPTVHPSGSPRASFAPKPFQHNDGAPMLTQPPAPIQLNDHHEDPATVVESLLEGPHLSEAAMNEHLGSGRAIPLFPATELPTGPVKFAGHWWAILKSAPHLGYTLVDDETLVTALNDTAQRRGMFV